MRTRLLSSGILILLAACAEREMTILDSGAVAAIPVTVTLVDSVPYDSDLEPGVLRRVAVRGPAGLDTIFDVLTQQRPVVVNDSLVVGFRYDKVFVRDIFTYAPATRRLETAMLPADFVTFSWPQLAPDGRHVVYLGRDSTGAHYDVVLAWPSAQVRYRGAPVKTLATDMGVENFAWETPRNFTLEIVLEEPFRATQRTRGSIGTDGTVTVTVDTLKATG